MSHSQQLETTDGRCTLCPACCPVEVASIGPDLWAPEVPLTNAGGACPKGTALTQLLVHRSRILTAARRDDGAAVPISIDDALSGVLQAAAGGAIHLLVDANVPVEEVLEAAAWCEAWEQAKLCLVVEPAEGHLLEGLDAGEATFLAPETLADCDAFMIIGNAFAANPTCSRAVFDRRAAESRTPIVVLDPAGGTASKFATHVVATSPAAELTALAAVARAAGVETDIVAANDDVPGAEAAGQALAGCKRLGILIAAEFGRTGHWRQIGYLAAKMGAALGGGVAPQTAGANALAAVRLAQQLGTLSLAEAIADDTATCVAIGGDVRGMLGRADVVPFAAAAPLPNESTAAATLILPVAMPGELSGTYCPPGAQPRTVSPVLPIPAGIPTPAGLVAALIRAAGVPRPGEAPAVDVDRRATVAVPAVTPEAPCANMALLLGRRAGAAGSGALTCHSTWQQATEPIPTLRISPADAASLAISHLACVTVTGNGGPVVARAMVSPELPAGVVVLPEGLAATRGLLGCEVDVEGRMILTRPIPAALTCENENDHDGDR